MTSIAARENRPGSAANGRDRRARARQTTRMAAWMMGACLLATTGAAEAHEPFVPDGAPSSSPTSGGDALALANWNSRDAAILAYDNYGRPRRTWRRARPRYRDEGTYYRREPEGWITLRGGFFDTEGVGDNDWVVGLKASMAVTPNLQLGVSTDLQRRSDSDRVRIEEFRDPSGNLIRNSVTTFESSSNLIPILGLVEMHVPSPGVHPYIGAGAGWEVLEVDGTDFTTGADFSDTFDGFGWQAWAGASFDVGRNARLVAEGYLNRGTVDRTVRDFDTGARVRQEIDVDGAGFRGGLAFGF